jgi:cell division protein FtsW (lipid II flippase)
VAVGVAGASEASRIATWTAVYLTSAGVVVTVMSLVRADRRQAGWAGGALLALASWVRLWDLGVTAPEAYTLPSAGALLLVGLLHLRRQSASSTVTALAPGLSLALVPSLLWALDEPYGVRVPLLGLACLALVIGGARLRWTAPLALGAAVGGLLVLRLAAPYGGDSVPHWALIGAAGALLIGVGVTWEQRLRDARDVLTYVRRLR